jgi:hypothetical protein
MKFRTVMVAASAAALSLVAAGSAAAQTLGHPDQSRQASAPQVTGSRLAKGLLPTSAYGADFRSSAPSDTGGKLLSTRVLQTPGGLSCGTFANDINIYYKYWGNTAGVASSYTNPDYRGNWPFTQFEVGQVVVQFATAHAASTFFNQAYAKFTGCRSYPVPNPSDTRPGGGSYNVTDTSTRKTTISGHQAFATSESWVPSDNSSVTYYIGVTYAVSGTNVYSLWEITGTNDEPSSTLMSGLIHRVQALYP